MSMEDDRLNYMKKNIIQSFKWQEDVVKVTASEFGISNEEMSQFYMDNLSMGTLDALFGCFETSKELELVHRFHADLRITFFCDTLDFIDENQAENLKIKLASMVMEGKSYEDALEVGRKELFSLMKEYVEMRG